MAGVHPEDRGYVNRQMAEYIAGDENHCEIVYRLRKGGGGYVWVKNTLSLIESEAGEARVYSVYRDMTREREEQSRLRQQYKDLIMQHYQTQGPDALVLGHCNITQNRILEIIDYTDSNLLGTFGSVREDFFSGLSSLVVDEEERRKFLDIYLNKPALEAFQRGDVERRLECFMRPPKEETGRYVQVNMNLVATPDSGDVTGILTVTDITRRTIVDRIMKQISAKGYDFISDVDLRQDRYYLLSGDELDSGIRTSEGSYSRRVEDVLLHEVVPRDRARMREALNPEYILKRLERESSYTLAFSMVDLNGCIRTKNITISAVDLRLYRVCVARADITESVREQQGMLHVIAYTFELAGFINISQSSLTLYTRETVLENLPPYFVEQYSDAVSRFVDHHASKADQEEARRQFRIEVMREKLEEKTGGYDFLFSCNENGQERYKQVNVMWGDVNHGTICLVRADVTDMLAAERRTKRELENALSRAEEANRAKSDFLSTMSHDIRTPMNAIMGMTALAMAHLGDQERVTDCLQKISISSRHLLSLINDILDMSKIESSQITLNRMRISIREMLGQLSAIMSSQARSAGLTFSIHAGEIVHPCFYGDALRINQILINILSNAVKYTPEGGRVDFQAEEIPPVGRDCARYRFTVSDTGVGMTEEFLNHVFEPFTRSRQTTRVEGTGLGLSITKGLVNLMGGAISVESVVHQGTVFQVELEGEIVEDGGESCGQSAGEPDGRQYADEVNRRTFGGRLFLVAEDNEINAEILCELLSMYGAKTVVRQNGAQAVRAFAEAAPGTYDAILMDVQMPEMNGYEATRAIRSMERPDAAVIPIIAMTANAFAEDVKAAMEAGMTAHVAKPIDVEILRGSLRNVLDGSGKGRG
ncbi:PAS domain-containing hybrid sensor histidine kinase/response regulator [Enterocloster asparagiformis]|uniref:PAS domain-containing hybrid sensor histidine kinase/response regulator n=1 Tax=Enterocloster asparagiformis TaxID=333367 RepID=UPI0004B60B67|nr:PAS domain-containing hybrid sensor histidine kinase/response regulator [Enterocloster asparagiformis]